MDANPEYIGPLVLTSERYKRLKAVRINFGDPGLTLIEGKNAQGKSSTLDSLLSLLLEDGQVDERPISEGEDSATVELTLTNGQKIQRTFKRTDKNPKGYTTSLLLLNPDGSKGERPAATIKDWIGSTIGFDPLNFAEMKPADRRTLLAKMLGIDLDSYEARIKPLESKRTQHFGVYDAAKRAHENKPAAPGKVDRVDVAGLSGELTAALGRREVISTKENELKDAERERDGWIGQVAADKAKIADLERQVLGMKESLADTERRLVAAETSVEDALKELEIASTDIPDIATIQARMTAAGEENRTADEADRIVQQRAQIDQTWINEQATRAGYDAAIKSVRDEKVKALADAKYPVDGMAFGDDDVLLNGFPFSQASQAEQIRAGIGVALAFNPKLRIIATHDASLLDEDNLRLLHTLAQERHCWVLGERVSNAPSDKPGGFFIEDGEVINGAA